MNEDDCGALDFGCKASQIASGAVGDAIQNFANAVLEMVGTAVTSLGTIWLYIGTPNLTDGSGSSSIPAGSTPPGAANVITALGYVTWVAFAAAAIATVWLGILVSTSLRRGEGALAVGRLGLILGGVVMIAAAGSLVSGLVPAGPKGAGGATLFIQSGLWWYMAALAVLSVIIAGVRMAWENRADPGKDLVKSLVTLLVVAGAGVTFTQLFITASDSFAVWLLKGSLQCDVATDQACFGKNITTLLALGANPATGGGLGAMLVIILGIVASLAAFVQIALMVARSGMLVILAGVLPLSAAATNTEMGKGWWRRCLGWLIAFLLYKPAAAIVYAAAFQLVGTKVFVDTDSVVSILTGLMLMILAVLAMPALMRFVTPLVSTLASGQAGGALAVGAMAALPTGATQAGQLLGGRSSSSPGGGSASPSGAGQGGGGPPGPGGATGPSAPSGATGSGGSIGQASQGGPGASGAGGSHGAGGSGAASPAAGGGTQAAAQAAQGGTAAGTASGAGGASTGAAAGGASAGGAAAAGAAGGPVGMVAAEGAARAAAAGQAVAGVARGAAQDATGEGGEPRGNS